MAPTTDTHRLGPVQLPDLASTPSVWQPWIMPQRDGAIELATSDVIRARPDTYGYGMGVGIVLFDEVYPGFPGDVRNASSFKHHVQYDIADGVTIDRLLFSGDPLGCVEPVIKSAQRLQRLGCRAIAAECGYFAVLQPAVADALDVPVFMSSLLQIPIAQRTISKGKVVGVLVATAGALTDDHLAAVGVDLASDYIVAGAMDDGRCPEFEQLWVESARERLPQASFAKAEADFLHVAIEFYEANPRMGAMVLECTGFPPFARKLQSFIGIPVFSWGTLLDLAYSVVVHPSYAGHV